MSIELYLAYVAATVLVLMVPGPTVMLVVGYALAEGRRAALATVVGVGLGDLTAMVVSLAGLGALMAASASLFTALKWIGAAYLIYLGIRLWRAPVDDGPAPPEASVRSRRSMAGHAFAVTALNPKGIAFFVAFLPQFVRPDAPALPQLLLLGGTFLVLAIVNAAAYALLAARARDALRRPGTRRAVNRIAGGVLMGAGALTAATHRAS